MNDATPNNPFAQQAKHTVKKMMTVGEHLHASSDALFFVRLFARACNSAVAIA